MQLPVVRLLLVRHIQEIIAELQGRTDIANDRMIQIEWHFIRLLDEHSLHSPKTLHKHLSQSPGFFDEQPAPEIHVRFVTNNEATASRTTGPFVAFDHDLFLTVSVMIICIRHAEGRFFERENQGSLQTTWHPLQR